MKVTVKLFRQMIELCKEISDDHVDQEKLFEVVQPTAFEILERMAGNDSSRHKMLAKELPWVFKLVEQQPQPQS